MIGGTKEKGGGSYDGGAQVLPSIRKTNPLNCFPRVAHAGVVKTYLQILLFSGGEYVENKNGRWTRKRERKNKESNWNGTESAPVANKQMDRGNSLPSTKRKEKKRNPKLS